MVNSPQWGSFQKPEQKTSLENQFNNQVQGEIKDENTPEPEQPKWGASFLNPNTYQGEPSSNEDEGWFDYITRNIAANASRVGEQIIGRYGNLEKFGKDLLTNYPQTGGLIGWGISELVGPEKWERMVKGPPNQQQLLPTSQDIKKLSQDITQGYTKPRTKGEEEFQGFTEDVGAVLSNRNALPIPGRNNAIQNSINAVLIPAASNVVKKMVKDNGFGDDLANQAKLAIWLPLMLANNVSGPRFASDLMNQGRNGIPANVQINTPRFIRSLDQLERSPMFINSDPRSALAREAINRLRNDIAQGQTNSRSLMTMYDGVNATKRNRGMFELNRNDQRFAIARINEVRDAIRNEIRTIGAPYPEALQNWENGVQAWSTIHRSQALSNWVESIAKGPYAKLLTGPAAALFGVGGAATTKFPPFMSIGAAGITPQAYKSGQVIYRMWNNQPLRNYYWNAIEAATEQNIPAFINNYEKLNKGLENDSTIKPMNKTEKKKKNK